MPNNAKYLLVDDYIKGLNIRILSNILWVITIHGWTDSTNQHKGTDYTGFWTLLNRLYCAFFRSFLRSFLILAFFFLSFFFHFSFFLSLSLFLSLSVITRRHIMYNIIVYNCIYVYYDIDWYTLYIYIQCIHTHFQCFHALELPWPKGYVARTAWRRAGRQCLPPARPSKRCWAAAMARIWWVKQCMMKKVW